MFDCGSCLLPQADDNVMRKMLSDEDELNARIYVFPSSMLKINGRKINYRDFISARPDALLVEALTRLLPRIQALDFEQILADTPYLSDLQRTFLTTYLSARRDKIFT